MSAMGMSEIVVIVLMLIVLAIPVAIVFGLIWYFASRGKKSDQPDD